MSVCFTQIGAHAQHGSLAGQRLSRTEPMGGWFECLRRPAPLKHDVEQQHQGACVLFC